jgi:trehalose 6-phosphate synthase/phosphatase
MNLRLLLDYDGTLVPIARSPELAAPDEEALSLLVELASTPGLQPSTPGSHVETKSASIAWHFRRAQREFGARQAHELRMLLGDALSNQPFEVLEGRKVIEVRLRGVSKALVAHRIQTELAGESLLVAIGDDRTDEELFRALPPSSVTVAAGSRPTCARFRVADYRAVRQVLRSLVADRRVPQSVGRERPGESALA